MFFVLTVLLFLVTAWLAMEIVQKIYSIRPMIIYLGEGLIVGVISFFWALLLRFLSTDAIFNRTHLIVFAIVGSMLAVMSWSVFWYFKDSTGKGRYTLRNLYTLIGLFRCIVYSINITFGVFFAIPT
jgi:uncharacterized membrane protein